MATDFTIAVEGGRTEGARIHTRLDIADIERKTGQIFCGFIDLDYYLKIPVFSRSSNPDDMARTLARAAL